MKVEMGRFLMIELTDGEVIIIDTGISHGFKKEVTVRSSKPSKESKIATVHGSRSPHHMKDPNSGGNIVTGSISLGRLAASDATIKDTAITNAKIRDLDATKITSGTLSAHTIVTTDGEVTTTAAFDRGRLHPLDGYKKEPGRKVAKSADL